MSSMDYREVVEHVRLPSRQRTTGTETGDPFSFNQQSNLNTIKDTPYFLMYGPEYDLSKPSVLKDYSHIFPSGEDPGTGAKKFLFSYIDEILDRQEPMQNYDKLGRVIKNVDKEANTLPDFLPSDNWKGPMQNYYFGRNYHPLQGVGYHRDKMRERYDGKTDDTSVVRHYEDCTFLEQISHPSLDSIKLVSMIAREDAIDPKKMDKHPTHFKFEIKDIFERLKRNDGAMVRLRLSSENIDDVLIAYLAGAFPYNKYLQHLMLHDNSISDKGLEALCMGLRWHPSIHTIWLGNNMITDVGVGHLMHLLRRNPCIKDLNISNRFPSKTWSEKEQRPDVHPQITPVGASEIAKRLVSGNCSLTNLNLSDQRILDQGSNQIFLSLGYSMIRSLNLKKNNLSDDCCKVLGNVFMSKINRPKDNQVYAIRLEKLDLSHNKITQLGISLFAEGLSGNITMRAFNLQNNNINDEGMSMLYDIAQKNSTLIVLGTAHNPSTDERAEEFIANRRTSLEGQRFLTYEEEYYRRIGFQESRNPNNIRMKNILLKMTKEGRDLSIKNPIWETIGRTLNSREQGGNLALLYHKTENNLGDLNDFGRRTYTRALESRSLNSLVVTPADYGPFRDDYNFLMTRQSSAEFSLRSKSRQQAAANNRINTATTNDPNSNSGLGAVSTTHDGGRDLLRTAGGGGQPLVVVAEEFNGESETHGKNEESKNTSLYSPIKISNYDISNSNETELEKAAFEALGLPPSRENSYFSRPGQSKTPFASSSSDLEDNEPFDEEGEDLDWLSGPKKSKKGGNRDKSPIGMSGKGRLFSSDGAILAEQKYEPPPGSYLQSRMTSKESYSRESQDLGHILGIPYTGSYGTQPVRSATSKYRDSGQNLMYLRVSTPLDKPGSPPMSFIQIQKDRDDFRKNIIESRKDNEEYWEKKRDRLDERPTAGKQMAAMKDPPQWFWDLLDRGQYRKYKQGIDRAPGVNSISTLAKMKTEYLKTNDLKTVDITKMCNNVRGDTRADRNMLKEEAVAATGFGGFSTKKMDDGGGGKDKGQLGKSVSQSVSSNKNKNKQNSKEKEKEKVSEMNSYNSANMAILDKEQRKPREIEDINDPKVLTREIMGLTKDQDYGESMNKRGLTVSLNRDKLDPILPKIIKK